LKRWAARTLDPAAGHYLASVRSQGPVALISTPRAKIQSRPVHKWEAVEGDAALADFDHVPLTDESGEVISRIYVRGTGPMELHERMFMSAGAPLIDFLETADHQRFRLLVDGGVVTGLVTLSDVQKLPVYPLLFGLLMAVELLLMEWLRQACVDDPDAWLRHLGPNQRRMIERYWLEAVQRDLAIDKLSLASFGHEIQAAEGMGLFDSHKQRHREMKGLKQLRNLVCHAAEFAPTPREALRIPPLARSAQDLSTWLGQRIKRPMA
jgi:hypothetical protein